MNSCTKNHPKRLILFRVLFALMTVSIMVFLFLMSAENADKSSATSGSVIEKIINTFSFLCGDKSEEETVLIIASLQHFVRKAAHFSIYACLGFSAAGFASTFKLTYFKRWLFCQMFCSAYAVSDEIHQSFSPGRSCQISDMLLDSLGSLLGIAFVLLVAYMYFKIKNRGIRMRKRELIKQVQKLTAKLIEADNVIGNLKNELADRSNEIAVLKDRLLKDEKCEETEKETDISTESAEKEPSEAVEESKENPPVVQNYHDFDFLGEPVSEDFQSIKDYAVKTIGKIVTESVKVNCVLAGSSSENKKELINLVLGRTEVAKEEISSLVTSELDEELLKISVDKECAAALEYFKIILGQI